MSITGLYINVLYLSTIVTMRWKNLFVNCALTDQTNRWKYDKWGTIFYKELYEKAEKYIGFPFNFIIYNEKIIIKKSFVSFLFN